MATLPSSKVELLAALRGLAERKPRSRDDLRELESESVALALHIQRRMSLPDVPHTIWHFLSDADIRFKDPGYCEMQLAEVRNVLAQWESQTASNNALERARDG